MLLLKILIMLKPFLKELVFGDKQKKKDPSIKIMVLMVCIMFFFVFFLDHPSNVIRQELVENRKVGTELKNKIEKLQEQAEICKKDQMEYRERLKVSDDKVEELRSILQKYRGDPSEPMPHKPEPKETNSHLLDKFHSLQE